MTSEESYIEEKHLQYDSEEQYLKRLKREIGDEKRKHPAKERRKKK